MTISGITSQQRKDIPLPLLLQTGLTVWLMAEDYTAGTWLNRGSAPQPTFVGTPAPQRLANTLNDRPVVRFTNAQGMLRGTGMCTDGSVPLTVLYLARQWGPVKGRTFTCILGAPATYNVLFGTHNAGLGIYDAGWYGPIAWPAVPTAWTGYGAICSAGPVSKYMLNGVFQGQVTTSIGHDNRYGISGHEPTAASTETTDADVAEVLVWNRTLSDAEFAQGWAYLKARYALA